MGFKLQNINNKYNKAYQTNLSVDFLDLKKLVDRKKVEEAKNTEKVKKAERIERVERIENNGKFKGKDQSIDTISNIDVPSNPEANLTSQSLDINSLLGNLDKKMEAKGQTKYNIGEGQTDLSEKIIGKNGQKNSLTKWLLISVLFVIIVGGSLFYFNTTNPVFFDNIINKITNISGGENDGNKIKTPLSDGINKAENAKNGTEESEENSEKSEIITTQTNQSTGTNTTKLDQLTNDLEQLSDDIIKLGEQAKEDKNKKVYEATKILMKNIKKLKDDIAVGGFDLENLEKSIKRLKKVYKKIH